jgi:membrane associated rhomboid family serine protease
MRPAAVGFQCPECVREGSRSTRQVRTPYGGQRTGNPALTSQVLIAVNVVIWIAILATGANRSRLVDLLALLPVGAFSPRSGTLVAGVADGAPWQLVTSMFTHVQVFHIGFNMLALWVLGPGLEAAVGRTRFLLLYFVSGLAGSACVMWFAAPNSQTLGASGAIFGLMGALLVIAAKVGGDVRGILTWIAINFVVTFVFAGYISWQGHVGGFVAGVATAAALAFAPRRRRGLWQGAGIAAVAVVVVVATAVRVAMLA